MSSINIAEEMAAIKVGYLDSALFNQIARLGVLSFIEVVALRKNVNKTEVLLTKRSDDDPFWSGMYHNPGTVLRPTDTKQTFHDAFERLFYEEYSLIQFPDGPYFSGFYFEELTRGTGFGIVSWIRLDDCSTGEFFDTADLPPNLIKEQFAYIQKCAYDFEKYLKGTNNPQTIEELIIK